MRSNFSKSQLKDIADHGADAGWVNLSYYNDTCKIYNHFKKEIWEMLLEDTEDMGYKNPFELIASFRSADIGNVDQFENLMTWYAAERIAKDLIDND